MRRLRVLGAMRFAPAAMALLAGCGLLLDPEPPEPNAGDRDGSTAKDAGDAFDGARPDGGVFDAARLDANGPDASDDSAVPEDARRRDASGGGALLFTTSQEYLPGTAPFVGIDGADRICQSIATAAGWPGTAQAILSRPGLDAGDRIPPFAGAVVNTAGQIVTSGRAGLWSGALVNAVAYDELGDTADDLVWTGTRSDGSAAGTNPSEFCENWNSASSSLDTIGGHAPSIDATWIDDGPIDCATPHVLYCIIAL